MIVWSRERGRGKTVQDWLIDDCLVEENGTPDTRDKMLVLEGNWVVFLPSSACFDGVWSSKREYEETISWSWMMVCSAGKENEGQVSEAGLGRGLTFDGCLAEKREDKKRVLGLQ